MKSMKGMGALGPICPPPNIRGQGPTCTPGFGAPASNYSIAGRLNWLGSDSAVYHSCAHSYSLLSTFNEIIAALHIGNVK